MHHHFLVQMLALVLDVGVSLHLLEFLLDVFFAHHQPLAVLHALPDEVGQGNHHVGKRDVHHQGAHHAAHARLQPCQSAVRHRHQFRQSIAHNQRHQYREKRDLEDRFQQLHQILLGEDVFQVLHHVQLLGGGLELFERQHHSHLQKLREHTDDQYDQHEGQHQRHGFAQRGIQRGGQRLLERHAHERRGNQDQAAQGFDDAVGIAQHVAEQRQHQQRLGEVLAVGDVALLPSVAQLLAGWLFCLFAAHGARHWLSRNGRAAPIWPVVSAAYSNSVLM
ncbi:hypothetical protein D3C72_1378490 [compost metagenome]